MNSLIVSGNLGNDAEIRYTQGGDAVCSVSIPASAGWGDKKTTTWIRGTIWGKRAEALAPYLLKGTPVVASGEFTAREWTNKDGVVKTSCEMRVSEITLMGKAKGGGASTGQQANAPQRAAQAPQAQAAAPDFGNFDDDIPF